MKPTSVPACCTGRGGSKLTAQQRHGAQKQKMSSSEAEQRLCAPRTRLLPCQTVLTLGRKCTCPCTCTCDSPGATAAGDPPCAEGKTAKSRIGRSGRARGWKEVNVKTLCTGETLFLRENKESVQKETRFICSTQVQQCKCSNDESEMFAIHTTPELLFSQPSAASGNKAPVRYG